MHDIHGFLYQAQLLNSFHDQYSLDNYFPTLALLKAVTAQNDPGGNLQLNRPF